MPSRVKQLKKDQSARTSTPSDLLAELHVYIVPVDKWIPFRRLAKNHVVDETVSAGFVRVSPVTTLLQLRDVLSEQLELDIPEHYVFIKSVGRNFTQVKGHQEQVVKVKNFLPPQASDPEIHILEVSEDMIHKSGSIPNLLLSDTELSESTGIGTARTSRLSYRGDVVYSSTLGLPEEAITHLEVVRPLEEAALADSSVEQTKYLVPTNNPNKISLDYKASELTNGRDSSSVREHQLAITSQKSKLAVTSDDDEDRKSQQKKDVRKKPIRRNVAGKANRYVVNSDETQNADDSRTKLEQEEDNEGHDSEGRDVFSGSYRREAQHRQTSSVTALNRAPSQESLEEEEQAGGGKTGNKFRSRYAKRQNRDGRRSSSLSTVDRQNLARSRHSSVADKSGRSYSDDTTIYNPQQLKLEQETRNDDKGFEDEFEENILYRNKSRELQLLDAEHVRAREELKREEARKFEEQIRKEEEMTKKSRKKSQNRNSAEILNLEGRVPLQEVIVQKNFSEVQVSSEDAGSHQMREYGDQINDGTTNDNIVLRHDDKKRERTHSKIRKRGVATKQSTKDAWEETGRTRKSSIRKKTQNCSKSEEELHSRTNREEAAEDCNQRGPTRRRDVQDASGRKTSRVTRSKANVEAELQEVQREKSAYEDDRTRLFMKARTIHEEILSIKEKRRQKWWDEYNIARRQGVRLEERQSALRQELEGLYRRIISTLVKREPLVTGVKGEPSRKASYKISVIRLRHEIADLTRRVEAIDIKLQAETKLRQQAEHEVRLLRSEVSRKKANVALTQARVPHLRNIAFIPDDILIRL